MGETIGVICVVGALYVGFFSLMGYEVKHMIAKEEKQTALYECLLKKLEEDC